MRATLSARLWARLLVLGAVVAGVVLATASASLASGPSVLGVSGWQVYAPGSIVANPDPFHGHGAIGEYAAAGAVPAQDSSAWVNCGSSSAICPSATTINMHRRSILSDCMNHLNFTYFQALVSIPEGTTISQFSVNMNGADDGAQISLVNSAHPNGVTPSNAYIFLGGAQATGDLHSFVVAGEVNRVIITQVDDCAVENNLNSAQVFLNGTVIPPAPKDTAAPVDAPVITPAANGNGWNNSDVSVAWNWTDTGTGASGVDPAKCTQSNTTSGEGTLTLSSTCYDLAGNHATDSRTFKVDKTAPTDAPVVTPAANGAGWNNSDVTVDWNWADGGSGTDNCDQSSTSTGEGAITLSSTCYDLAGNSTTDSVTVNVDKTAPTDAPVVTPAANGAGWNNTDVSVAWNWTDGGSGVDPANCTQSSSSTGEGTITLTSTCTDLAGNSSSDSRTVKVDKTAPTVTYSGNGGTYTVDQTVSITCAASDALSGTSSTCSGASGPAWLLGLGVHNLSATAVDNAGNTGFGSTSYTVTVDGASLCRLVQQFVANAGIANSMCVKLNAAAAAAARGQTKTKANNIGAFDNEVTAQSGKALTADHASVLISLAAAL